MWQNQSQDQALLSEITEEDLEAIRQREEAIQQIEVSNLSCRGLASWKCRFLVCCIAQCDKRNANSRGCLYIITRYRRDYQAFLKLELSDRRKN